MMGMPPSDQSEIAEAACSFRLPRYRRESNAYVILYAAWHQTSTCTLVMRDSEKDLMAHDHDLFTACPRRDHAVLEYCAKPSEVTQLTITYRGHETLSLASDLGVAIHGDA